MVVKTGDETLITTEPSILNVWKEHGTNVRSILIDIPIGLPESDVRKCDTEASERLATRGSSIFAIPPRDVVESDHYKRARERNGGSLSSQSWWLFPRILEVDTFLQEHDGAIDIIYESHPEVCFAELTGRVLDSKNTATGRSERLEVIENATTLHNEVLKIVRSREDGAEWHERISKGRLDDVIDAAVLAYTAEQLDLGPRSSKPTYPALPTDTRERDETLDIPMEIVYPNQ